jgi:hypothetical protein
MTDAELKTSSELLTLLQELHTRKLLDRTKLEKKIKSLSKTMEDYLDPPKI